ncbi:MAG TPA: transposase family protein [Chloroflexota bacterium]|nr:transposase family protein [Chloroflexota bacterium]
MLQYRHLSRYPVVFRALTGHTLAQFDALLADVGPRFRAAEAARLSRPQRRRARGGGRHSALEPRDQLLLTVVWLRRYPIYAVLGFLFGVEETTALRTVGRVLPVLEAAGLATFRLPDPGKGKRPNLDALLADTPVLAVIVDTFEQRVQRPRDRAEADTFYSGKKKQHTLKSQIAIDERDGRVVDVSESVRGPTNDLTLLKDSGLLKRLPDGVGALGDLAYVGCAALHPGAATPRRKPRGKPRPAEDIAYNTAFARRRVPVEHTIGRLRCYEALRHTDRHHRRDHTRRVRAVAGLVNRCRGLAS